MANDNLPDGVRSLLASQGKTYVSLETEASGDGNTFAFEKDDYTPDSMAVVNKMAVDTIGESQNVHKLNEQRVSVRITQDNGKPSLIVDGGPGSVNSYSSIISEGDTANNDSSGIKIFERASNSEQFFGLDNQFEVIKGNAEPTNDNQKKYTTLLVNYNTEKGNSTIAKAVGELQNKNNRFSEENQFLTDGQKENESGANVIPIQNIPGQYTPQVWPNTETGTNVELRNLKNLGVQILLKAAGENYVPDNPDSFEEAFAARGASLTPGYVRLGAKLPMSEIQVDNIVSNINPEFSKNKSPSLSGTPTLSHGSYYNPLAPFDSFDSRFNVAGAAVLVATVAGIVKALAPAIDFSEKTNEVLGAVFNTKSKAFFNVQYQTRNPFVDCVNKGFQRFFSLEGENFEASVLNAAGSFNETPGYYNTILRGVLRLVQYDLINNGLSFAELAGASNSTTAFNTAANRDLDINRNVGLTNDVTNTLNIVRAIADSKLFGFINILAQIGDIAITQENFNLLPDSGSDPLTIGPSPNQNIIDFVTEDEEKFGSEYLIRRKERINPAALIMKDRLSETAGNAIGHKYPLSWAGATTPSTYLLPKTIINAAEKLGDTGAVGLKSKLSGINGIINKESGNRLDSAMVDKIENLLDASYMPFYFHDLRTNEIISFHAFLESITDNYAADYNEQTAYGRIGKIYSYKNTDRTIALSFMAVATNDRDFDEMWWKINKLITMVYPQYTKGRLIERQNQKFIQPFSQLPSASPLIRLRLGDLLKSNYSKFHLARMFGLGESDETFSVVEQQKEINQPQVASPNPEEDNTRAALISRLESGNFEVGDRFIYIRDEIVQIPSANGNNTSSGDVVPLRRRGALGRNRRNRQRQTIPERTGLPPENSIGTIVEVIPTGLTDGVNATYIYMASFENGNSLYINPKNYQGRITRIGVDTTYVEEKVRQLFQSTSTNNTSATESGAVNTIRAVQEFFNSNGPNSNPIFQSFNTVRGKGIPGFIKSIDFDWAEALWETADGSKAPKSCKIAINFSPIWDINPGIDSNGFNTSPVYGIGNTINSLAQTNVDGQENSNNTTMALMSQVIYTTKNGNNNNGGTQ